MGLEQGARYVLTGPDGHQAVFNDPADTGFVGYLTEPPAGLDSADVRGITNTVAQGDGARHGSYFYGARGVTLTGMIPPDAGPAVVNDRIERLARASNAMRGDCVLHWTETGEASPRYVTKLRRSQPLRVAGTRPKTFQLQMTAADPLVVSNLYTLEGGVSSDGDLDLIVTNIGNAPSFPRIVWTTPTPGTAVEPRFINRTTGEELAVRAGAAVFAGQVILDLAERTLTSSAVDRYGDVDYLLSEWWPLVPGPNVIGVEDDTDVAGAFSVVYRHAWL